MSGWSAEQQQLRVGHPEELPGDQGLDVEEHADGKSGGTTAGRVSAV